MPITPIAPSRPRISRGKRSSFSQRATCGAISRLGELAHRVADARLVLREVEVHGSGPRAPEARPPADRPARAPDRGPAAAAAPAALALRRLPARLRPRGPGRPARGDLRPPLLAAAAASGRGPAGPRCGCGAPPADGPPPGRRSRLRSRSRLRAGPAPRADADPGRPARPRARRGRPGAAGGCSRAAARACRPSPPRGGGTSRGSRAAPPGPRMCSTIFARSAAAGSAVSVGMRSASKSTMRVQEIRRRAAVGRRRNP